MLIQTLQKKHQLLKLAMSTDKDEIQKLTTEVAITDNGTL